MSCISEKSLCMNLQISDIIFYYCNEHFKLSTRKHTIKQYFLFNSVTQPFLLSLSGEEPAQCFYLLMDYLDKIIVSREYR